MALNRFCMAAAAVLVFGASVMAQNIADVQVEFLGAYKGDASDILTRCMVKPGTILSEENITTDTRNLLATEQYTSVEADISAVGNGVRVTYRVQRRNTLDRDPVITGNKAVSTPRLRTWLDLKEGAFVDDAVVAAHCIKVRDEYFKRHYPDIRISYTLQPVNPEYGTAMLEINVVEGAQRSFTFEFKGNSAVPTSDLKATFDVYSWYDPRGWFTDKPYNELKIEEARTKAQALYFERGFLDATISQPEYTPVSTTKTRAVFTVDEGPCYVIDSVALEGATLFPEADLLKAARLPPGIPAGSGSVDAALKRVRDFYTSRGYIDVGLRSIVESPGEDGKARVRFAIRDENIRQIAVRNIIIRGNKKTKDKVIRREIELSPGDLLDATKVERGEVRLRNLNYFKEVRSYYAQVPGDDSARDVVFEVEEKSTGSFMVGIGFSTVDNVIGFAEISQSNFDITNWKTFTGAGQKARASVEVGTDSETFLISWTEPWLFDRPLELTTDLYRRRRSYDEYDDVRTGGSISLAYPLSIGGRIGYRLSLEQVQMKDVTKTEYYHRNSLGYFYTAEDDSYFRPALRVYWGNDTRNRVFIPTRGHQWQLWAETSFSGEAAYSLGANGRKWFEMPEPLDGHVLSVRGRIETVDAWSGDLPITERLFLGGGRTVRGVEFRSLGPKVSRLPSYYGTGGGSWHPIGGQTLTFASIEYTIPLIKAVRLGIFSDFGSLGDDAFSPEFSDYIVTAGAGLRIDIPGFPIRLDFAAPIINNDEDADKEFFSFWIGFE